jgi:hypothetical protein
MADYIKGRLADYVPEPSLTHPDTFSGIVDSLAIGTHNWYFAAPEAGYLRYASFRCNLNGGTNTIDILKNGTTILAATHVLTTNALRILEGLGADATGEDRDFNTDTAANVAKIKVAKGDIIQVQSVVATAVSLDFMFALTFDLRQPRTKPDRS